MSPAQLDILMVAMVTAAACAIPGCFLVLRRMAMLSDAISHAILPGIVVVYLLGGHLGSPWMLVAAALTGVLTVWLVELLFRGGNLREDAAIGLVFPVLFSVGVVLISRYAGKVHLDLDAVLMGEIAFVPFERLRWGDNDLGPRGLWLAGGVLLLNVTAIGLFFKELKLTTFDPVLAALSGIAPAMVHYLFMTLVSITVVGAFDVVGAILVVSLIVAPPSAAYLCTDRLPVMLALSVVFGVVAALAGFAGALWLDVSIAGMMAAMSGLVLVLAMLAAPERGLWVQVRRRRAQALRFAFDLLLVHLYQHEHGPEAHAECRYAELHEHLTWPLQRTREIVSRASEAGLVQRADAHVRLTERGRERARLALTLA